MDIELKKFSKDIRALDKEMRAWYIIPTVVIFCFEMFLYQFKAEFSTSVVHLDCSFKFLSRMRKNFNFTLINF